MDIENNQLTTPNKPHVTMAAIDSCSDTSKTDSAIVPQTGTDDPAYTYMPGISGKTFANRHQEACEIMSIFSTFKPGGDEPRWKYENPPPVPVFWHFAPLTLRSTASAMEVQEKFFNILHNLNVDVEVTSSTWKYRLQTVCGEAYLDIECHFFKQDFEIIIDINLLSGERFVWHNLAQNIRVIFNGGNSNGKCHKPRDYPWRSEQLFQLLEHGSMNDKRRAMRSLALSTTNVDISKNVLWINKSTGTFLEKEIQRWAEYIKVNRAHL